MGGHAGIGVFVPNPRLRATQQHADGILRLHTLVKIVGIREQIALQRETAMRVVRQRADQAVIRKS